MDIIEINRKDSKNVRVFNLSVPFEAFDVHFNVMDIGQFKFPDERIRGAEN